MRQHSGTAKAASRHSTRFPAEALIADHRGVAADTVCASGNIPWSGEKNSAAATAGAVVATNASSGASTAASREKGWLPRSFHAEQLARCEAARLALMKDWEARRRYDPEMDESHVAWLQQTFTFKGYIDEVEMRAITLEQLRFTVQFAKRSCQTWFDTAPASASRTSGMPLLASILNLYHLNAWVIRPATKEHECSFVELLALGEQQAAWFVSHWWGEAVGNFLQCLEHHAVLRGLPETTPFWVCAYANRQHCLQEEITPDPRESSFYKAMVTAGFRVLLVLDSKSKYGGPATALTRVWCAFEETMCLEQAGPPLDIATCASRGVELLTKGLTCDEEGLEANTPGAGLRSKSTRERGFPLDIVEAGLCFDITKAKASVASDRTRILNCVAGLDVRSEEAPPKEHPKLTEASVRLRSLFAFVFLRRAFMGPACEREAVYGHRLLEKLVTAARGDEQRTALELNLGGCDGLVDSEIHMVAQALPPSLRNLTIDFQGTDLSDDCMEPLASNLPPNMEELDLEFARCLRITFYGVRRFLIALPRGLLRSLTRLRLGLQGTRVHDEAVDLCNLGQVQGLLDLFDIPRQGDEEY